MPLLPLRWQLRLGERRLQRATARDAHPEQALPTAAPEEAPDGIPPSVPQQWRDDQELRELHLEPDQAPVGEQPRPGGQHDEVAQVTPPACFLNSPSLTSLACTAKASQGACTYFLPKSVNVVEEL